MNATTKRVGVHFLVMVKNDNPVAHLVMAGPELTIKRAEAQLVAHLNKLYAQYS